MDNNIPSLPENSSSRSATTTNKPSLPENSSSRNEQSAITTGNAFNETESPTQPLILPKWEDKPSTLIQRWMLLLGIGLILIFLYNFMATHSPSYFEIFTITGEIIYNITENIIGPTGLLLAIWDYFF